METIEYQLKSNPKKSVRVPADYASKSEGLVKLAVENPAGLADAISEHPYLSNPGILRRTVSLAGTEVGTLESLKLQDEVYLRICIYGNEQKMRSSERDKSFDFYLEAMELDESLIQTVRHL